MWNRGEVSWTSATVSVSQVLRHHAGGGLLACLAGSASPLLIRFEAPAGAGLVAFAAKLPGHIVALDVDSKHAYLVHRDGWIFGTEYVSPSVGCQQSLGGALFGEEGFVLQRLDGQGTAWIELGDELVRYDLAPSPELLVHPGHLRALAASMRLEIT